MAGLSYFYGMTTEQYINDLIAKDGVDTNQISDKFHTFGELYEHRIQLFIALCKWLSRYNDHGKPLVWRSKKHSDGELAFGGTWFVLGMFYEAGQQITYHIPLSKWDECNFAAELEKAPEWDGHTPSDVLERLKSL